RRRRLRRRAPVPDRSGSARQRRAAGCRRGPRGARGVGGARMTVAAQPELGLRLDPALFEIVRHRLWYLNDEGALTISRVSGSPVATEVFDMNTGIMNAVGDLVYIDNFICAQATTLSSLVRHLLSEYADNPGFGPEDVFLCNDPYVSVCHQTCVQVAAPVFWEDELVAWSGASLHVIDV